MKTDLTELVFILDRSGSMAGLEDDTIGGFNAMLEKQKKQAGDCTVTTVLFDDHYELLHDRIPMSGITPLTDKDYYVRGCTALLDAIGRTINKIGSAQKHTADDERAEKVLVIIITDGHENASREYGNELVKTMIERQKERYGWEFLFLGANIDAVETAARFSIEPDRAANYHSDAEGTRLNYGVLSETVSYMRACGSVDSNWKNSIDADFKKRKKK